MQKLTVCFRTSILNCIKFRNVNSNFLVVAIFVLFCFDASAFPFVKPKVKKANEALLMYDYFKAKKLYYELIKSHTVESSYGLSIIYSRNDNPFINLDSALYHAQRARKLLKEINCIYKDTKGKNNVLVNEKECLFKIQFSKSTDSLFEKIDSILFVKAAQINSIESYKLYQNYYKNEKQLRGKYYNESKLRIGNLLFTTATQQKKSKSLIELSNQCDSSFCLLSNQIKTSIPKLILDLQFDEMASKRDIKSYVEFRIQHPNSYFETAIDDSIFSLATTQKSEKNFYDFIKANPNNRNVSNAWQSIYNSASNDNSQGFFKRFLEKYPEYPYRENVARELKLSQTIFSRIRHSKLFGFCDENGQELIKPIYEFVDEFSEGYCVATLNGKSGYIARNGEILIPFVYDEAESFHDGMAIVKRDNKYAIINKKNDVKFISEFEINDYSENLSVAKLGDKFGYLDLNCSWKIKPEFDNAYDFKNGVAVVEKEGKVGLIDKEGNLLINFEYEWIDSFYGNIIKLQLEESSKLYSISDKKVILENVDFIDVISDGMAAFYKDDKVGYLDSIGNIVISPQFEVNEETKLQQQFADGYAMVIYKGKNILIDKTGKKIIASSYQSIKRPSNELLAVKKKNKWGFIDLNNEIKIKFQYQEVTSFIDSLAIVKQKNKSFVIDTKGNIVQKVGKKKFLFLGRGYIIIEDSNKKYFADKKFATIVGEIDDVKPFKNNLWQIDKAGKIAYFDYLKRVIIWKEDGFILN